MHPLRNLPPKAAAGAFAAPRRGWWRRLALWPMLFALGACGDIARVLTPGSRAANGPAMISFTASVPRRVATANDVVTLNVTASYRRTDGSLVPIGAQVLSLSSESVQSVPIPIDVVTCLADAARDLGGGPATGTSCAVVLNLSLVVNGIVVDQQTVGPLRLQPGGTTTVSEPVTLFDLAAIEIQHGSTTVSPTTTMQALLGSALPLSARVLDARGRPVPDRAVGWSSSATTVATVDASSGVVTTVAVGTAIITARAGSVSATAALNIVRAPAALTVLAGVGGGSGTVRSIPAGIDCRVTAGTATGTCTFTFPGDAAVTLTPVVDAGSTLAAWGDACSAASVSVSCQVVMSQPRSARVQFAAMRRVSIASMPAGTGRGRVTGPNGIDCRIAASAATGTCAVDVMEGTPLLLTAAPEALPSGGAPQFFAGWGGACASATGTTCTLTPTTANLAATAQFFDAQPIAVSVTGSGGGTVTGGSTIACVRSAGATTGTCSESATYGTSVTLTALPNAQSRFLGWSGACTGTSTTCTTTLTESRSVGAIFSLPTVTLTVNLVGPGGGSVQVGDRATCSIAAGQATNSCTTTFDVGTAVTLTGNAGAGSSFTGFVGACSGTGSCRVVLDRSLAVSATFSVTRFPLTVTLSGTGGGTVALGDGSSCSLAVGQGTAVCTTNVTAGTTVSVAPSPSVASTFEGFSGDCSGRDACSASMTAPRRVGVTFTRRQLELSVVMSGTGGGTVVLGGAPICALTLGQGTSTCTRLVDAGSTLSLTSTPSWASTFDGFSGSCAGLGACTLAVGVTPVSVSAVFTRRQVPLTLQLRGQGGGSVRLNGAVVCTIALGQTTASCSQQVDFGSSLTLTASPTIESSFAGFGGACASGQTCTITPEAATTVTADFSVADFAVRQFTLTVAMQGSGGGTVSVAGAPVCTLAVGSTATSCTRQYAYGTVLTLTSSPTFDSAFDGYDTACTGSTCTVTVTSDRRVGATFTRRMLPLVLSLSGPASGSVFINGTSECTLLPGVSSTSCTRMLPVGSTAVITARSTSSINRYVFSLDCEGAPGTAPTCSLVMSRPREVGISFR